MKKVKDIQKDPRAVAVALVNFQKICGVKLNVMFSYSGQEDQKQRENMQSYVANVNQEIKDNYALEGAEIITEFREEEIIMYGMRTIYKFIEIH